MRMQNKVLYNLDTGKCGNYKLTSKILKMGETVNLTFPVKGEKKNKKIITEDEIIYELNSSDYCPFMMATSYEERTEMKKAAEKLYGKVLIGGLGLGLILYYCQENKNINNIVVIEENEEVVKLVKPKYKQVKKIIISNLSKYLKETKEHYDSGYFDTHPTKNENYKETYKKQRYLGDKVVDNLELFREKFIIRKD